MADGAGRPGPSRSLKSGTELSDAERGTLAGLGISTQGSRAGDCTGVRSGTLAGPGAGFRTGSLGRSLTGSRSGVRVGCRGGSLAAWLLPEGPGGLRDGTGAVVTASSVVVSAGVTAPSGLDGTVGRAVTSGAASVVISRSGSVVVWTFSSEPTPPSSPSAASVCSVVPAPGSGSVSAGAGVVVVVGEAVETVAAPLVAVDDTVDGVGVALGRSLDDGLSTSTVCLIEVVTAGDTGAP